MVAEARPRSAARLALFFRRKGKTLSRRKNRNRDRNGGSPETGLIRIGAPKDVGQLLGVGDWDKTFGSPPAENDRVEIPSPLCHVCNCSPDSVCCTVLPGRVSAMLCDRCDRVFWQIWQELPFKPPQRNARNAVAVLDLMVI